MTILFLVAAHVSVISKLMQFHILLVCTAYRRRRFSGAVFIPGIFGGISPKTYNPPKRLPNCVQSLTGKLFRSFVQTF